MQRFKPGQVYYNHFTKKNTLLILEYPRVRRIASVAGRPTIDMEISERVAKNLVLIGNNYSNITRVDVTTLSDTDPRYTVLKTKPTGQLRIRESTTGRFSAIDTDDIKRHEVRLAELPPAPLCEREDSHGRSEYQKELAGAREVLYDRGLCPNNETDIIQRDMGRYKLTTCYAPLKADSRPYMLDVAVNAKSLDTDAIKCHEVRLSELPPAPCTGRGNHVTVRPTTVEKSYEEMRDIIRQHEKTIDALKAEALAYRTATDIHLAGRQSHIVALAGLLYRVLDDDATDDQIRDVLGRLPLEIQALFAKK